MFKIEITDERLTQNNFLPATKGSVGIDLKACLDATLILAPGASQLIPVGFKIQLEDEFCAFLLPRSSVGFKRGGILANTIGTIDSDYRGNVFVSMWNRNKNQNLTIEPMERIAQMVILKTYTNMFIEYIVFFLTSATGYSRVWAARDVFRLQWPSAETRLGPGACGAISMPRGQDRCYPSSKSCLRSWLTPPSRNSCLALRKSRGPIRPTAAS